MFHFSKFLESVIGIS